jgi:hypothetical protein
MKLNQLPARQGALWVSQGFAQFFSQPLMFSMLFSSFFFACMLLLTVPWVGGLTSMAALPLVCLGFMIATRSALEKKTASTPMVFVQPLQGSTAQRRDLLALCLAYALLSFLAMSVSDWVDGGALAGVASAMVEDQTSPEEMRVLLEDPRLFWGLLIGLGLTGLLSVPFWHAPALVHFHQQPWGKAIFSSCVACWRNKAAFMVYGLTWVAVGGLFALLSSVIFGLLGQPKLVILAAAPGVLMFSTVFYASLYFTFSDCFAGEAEEASSNVRPH